MPSLLFTPSRREIKALSDQLAESRQIVGRLQHSVDLLQKERLERRGYTGNPYTTYAAQVEALSNMFNARASWGCQTAENVVSLRAAFTIGGGVKCIRVRDGAGDAELAAVDRFMRHNGLTESTPQDWQIAAEIEGKLAVGLYPNPAADIDGIIGQIDARYLSWRMLNYSVETPPEDYAKFLALSYMNPKTREPVRLLPPQFTFRRFGGEVTDVNEPTPKCANVLQEMEFLSQARVDWRRANNLFATPTPVAIAGEGQTPADVKLGLGTDANGNLTWRTGMMIILAHGGSFDMVNLDGAGADAIEREMISLAKHISGQTGIPVSFLGHPDLMHYTSVADSLFSLIIASVQQERKIAQSFYTELFRNAVRMTNSAFQTGYDPLAIRAEVPEMTEEKMRDIRENWLPLFLANLVPARTVLERIPDINVEEVERLLLQEREERVRMSIAAYDAAGETRADDQG
jgi:hypothetical protein